MFLTGERPAVAGATLPAAGQEPTEPLDLALIRSRGWCGGMGSLFADFFSDSGRPIGILEPIFAYRQCCAQNSHAIRKLSCHSQNLTRFQIPFLGLYSTRGFRQHNACWNEEGPRDASEKGSVGCMVNPGKRPGEVTGSFRFCSWAITDFGSAVRQFGSSSWVFRKCHWASSERQIANVGFLALACACQPE